MIHLETLGIHTNRAEMMGLLILSTFWWLGINNTNHFSKFEDV